jgi:hypothetical protein
MLVLSCSVFINEEFYEKFVWHDPSAFHRRIGTWFSSCPGEELLLISWRTEYCRGAAIA